MEFGFDRQAQSMVFGARGRKGRATCRGGWIGPFRRRGAHRRSRYARATFRDRSASVPCGLRSNESAVSE